MKNWVMAVVVAGCAGSVVMGKEMPPLVHEAVMNVPAEKVWAVFSTGEGYKNFGMAKAEVDFRIGGKMRSHYGANGELGDAGTIEQTILAYEPMRMVSWRCTKVPQGFPFPAAMEKCWNVAYIEDLGDGRTRLTLKGMGYDDASEESVKMRAFFDAGNAWSLQKLRSNLEGTPAPTTSGHDAANAGKGVMKMPVLLSSMEGEAAIETEAVVAAPIAEVWKSWATSEGMTAFTGAKTAIEPAPGGKFEIYWKGDAPEGERGSEGCRVLSAEPMRMLSFDWNAPPQFAHARAERTWVVVSMEEAGSGQTRVRITHHGWAEKIATQSAHAEEWRSVRAYFSSAWPRVLGALQDRFAPPESNPGHAAGSATKNGGIRREGTRCWGRGTGGALGIA